MATQTLFKTDNHHLPPWLKKINPDKRVFKDPVYSIMKRFLDVFSVLVAVPFWVPLILVSALLIKLESPRHPVLYKQRRTGMGGQRFYIYKFRTMVPNAEQLKKELMHLNELELPDFKISDDPRVTQTGRILRKLSLDELPQLLNVLRGDMSLVGPRPTFIHPDHFSLWQSERFDVLPGITGLWQIVGRGAVNFDERIRLDIAYVERRCLWVDLQILVRTFSSIIKQRGTF